MGFRFMHCFTAASLLLRYHFIIASLALHFHLSSKLCDGLIFDKHL